MRMSNPVRVVSWTVLMTSILIALVVGSAIRKRSSPDYIVAPNAFVIVPRSHWCEKIVVQYSQLTDPDLSLAVDVRARVLTERSFCDLLLNLADHRCCIRPPGQSHSGSASEISPRTMLDWVRCAQATIETQEADRELADLCRAFNVATTFGDLASRLKSSSSFSHEDLRVYPPQQLLTRALGIAMVLAGAVWLGGLALFWRGGSERGSERGRS